MVYWKTAVFWRHKWRMTRARKQPICIDLYWLLTKKTTVVKYGYHFKLVPDSPKYLSVHYLQNGHQFVFWLVYHSCIVWQPYLRSIPWCCYSYYDCYRTLLLSNISETNKASTFVINYSHFMDVTHCWFYRKLTYKIKKLNTNWTGMILLNWIFSSIPTN